MLKNASKTQTDRRRNCSRCRNFERSAAARSLTDGVPFSFSDAFKSSTDRSNILSNGCRLNHKSNHQTISLSQIIHFILNSYRSISFPFFCCSFCRFSAVPLSMRCSISSCLHNFCRLSFSLALFLKYWNESIAGVDFGLLEVDAFCGEIANDVHGLNMAKRRQFEKKTPKKIANSIQCKSSNGPFLPSR